MMRLSIAQCSERGGRIYNEDSLGFCANETLGCFVLADGTGGYDGGGCAAETVVQQVLSVFSTAPHVSRDAIDKTIITARHALADARKRHPEYAAMNTTIATLMLDTQQALAYWSHLGDSRIYFFRNGRARALTNDHSVLQSMIDAGILNSDARGNIERNTLYAAVGSGNVPPRAVCEKPLALLSGDIFLLCSDGFWESVGEDTMEAQLQSTISPDQWIDGMVGQVSNPGAAEQDNFSAMAVWVGDREEVTRIFAQEGVLE